MLQIRAVSPVVTYDETIYLQSLRRRGGLICDLRIGADMSQL